MTSKESEAVLRQMIGGTTPGLQSLSAQKAVELMLLFYREQRADDCQIADDGDMLLFEWGVYPWGGESFRVKVTRQFIPQGGEDDAIYQLSLTVHYSPNEETRSAAAAARERQMSNKWCGSPKELPEFDAFIQASLAMRLAAAQIPSHVTLEYNHTA